MALLTGRNRTYLLLAVLLAAVVIAAVWATMAGADSPETGTENADHSATEAKMGASGRGIPYDGPSGIWVNGTGRASAAPDIAVVSLGVEAIEETAAKARSSAATAMTDVIGVLKEAGVAEIDIQTRHFNISPRYQHVEIERCDEDDTGLDSTEGEQESTSEKTCYTAWENRLIGYSVSNQASVKVRNLDNAGSIVDKVAEAAGDLVRINGVNFQIEDTQSLEDSARADAVADLFRKAEMLAELSGVELGPLVHLNEQAPYRAPQVAYARAESVSADSSGAATLIAGGELEVSTTLQGVFLIAAKTVPEPEETPEPELTEEPTEAPTEEPQQPTPQN